MEVDSLAALLDERRYNECREAAEWLLRAAQLTDSERGQVCLALSYALFALHSGQEAIGPAELAVYFSRHGGDYDLAGRTLCHLAVLYHAANLPKRAVACLESYFEQIALYQRATALEGWVLAHMALCYQAMGRGAKALEYCRKAYRWHVDTDAPESLLDQHRGELAWQYLRMGEVEPAGELLAQSYTYLKQAPNDLEARARHMGNTAYRAYLTGSYAAAIDTAVQVLHMRGISALRKAQACLTLHYTARALGLVKEAMGLGTLTRIQANMARRSDLEDEATRSMLHIQPYGGLPLMDELLSSLKLAVAQPASNM